jgi:hypothetical protein
VLLCSSHDREVKLAALERRGWGASGAGLLWLNEAAPSLCSNIPQTAVVATLDTYDLFRLQTAAVSF